MAMFPFCIILPTFTIPADLTITENGNVSFLYYSANFYNSSRL